MASVFKHQAGKIWACNLVPAHAIERSFCIHTSNDQSCSPCRVTKGNPRHSQLGAEGNIDILALKADSGTMVSVLWRAIRDFLSPDA